MRFSQQFLDELRDRVTISEVIGRRVTIQEQDGESDTYSLVFPGDGDSVDVLLKNSDTAMYHAKEEGRNNVQYYSNAMNATANERLLLEAEVRHALERQEFVVHYQPQVRLDSGAGDRVDASAYPWGERQAMANAIIAIGPAGSSLPRLAARGRMLLRQWRDRKGGPAGGTARTAQDQVRWVRHPSWTG